MSFTVAQIVLETGRASSTVAHGLRNIGARPIGVDTEGRRVYPDSLKAPLIERLGKIRERKVAPAKERLRVKEWIMERAEEFENDFLTGRGVAARVKRELVTPVGDSVVAKMWTELRRQLREGRIREAAMEEEAHKARMVAPSASSNGKSLFDENISFTLGQHAERIKHLEDVVARLCKDLGEPVERGGGG